MKSMKALLVIAALTVSSLAMASGGGDRTFARMEAAQKNAMEAYQATQKRADQTPVAKSKAKAVNQAKY
ncbi:co-regulatory protein PtrA N-terminal domain-containing protein [Pseudomonas akapageensis]|uniref:co-regulatory protein PtrA N-terminal domain-containing protein n=1 Tax=Pseudomonas akapageensis TaxID=2609961 RepID=UPI001407BB4A|nr:co-regulatory protein PtrA N-terminal domain-containing protein [Pseudomonas akapageensis]